MVVLITMIVVSIFAKGFFQLVPILISVIVGYLLALAMGMVDTAEIAAAPWIGLSEEGIRYLTSGPWKYPGAGISGHRAHCAGCLRGAYYRYYHQRRRRPRFLPGSGHPPHYAGRRTGHDCGGIDGSPANTTYSENTGVLAVANVYDPSIIRIAAVFAIVLSMFGKFGAFVRTIPGP